MASRRGYISFLLLIPLAWLLLLPILSAPAPPSSSYVIPALMRTGDESIALKRALLVSERQAVQEAQPQIITLAQMEGIILALGCNQTQSPWPPDSPDPALPFPLLSQGDQDCYLNSLVMQKWSSLLQDWNSHSDYSAQLFCGSMEFNPYAPAIPSLPSPAWAPCQSMLYWDGRSLSLAPGWQVVVSSSTLPDLKSTSPLPSTDVTP